MPKPHRRTRRNRLNSRALFLIYRPDHRSCGLCKYWRAHTVQLVSIAVSATLLASDIRLHFKEPTTVVSLLSTFALAAVGYSAWARRRLSELPQPADTNAEGTESGESDEPHVDWSGGCVAFRDRIDLHMIMIAVSYLLLLSIFLIEEISSLELFGSERDMKVVAIAWFLPNLFLLGYTATSLNDFLASHPADSSRNGKKTV